LNNPHNYNTQEGRDMINLRREQYEHAKNELIGLANQEPALKDYLIRNLGFRYDRILNMVLLAPDVVLRLN